MTEGRFTSLWRDGRGAFFAAWQSVDGTLYLWRRPAPDDRFPIHTLVGRVERN